MQRYFSIANKVENVYKVQNEDLAFLIFKWNREVLKELH